LPHQVHAVQQLHKNRRIAVTFVFQDDMDIGVQVTGTALDFCFDDDVGEEFFEFAGYVIGGIGFQLGKIDGLPQRRGQGHGQEFAGILHVLEGLLKQLVMYPVNFFHGKIIIVYST
jgi:hypothetical protein